MKKFLLFLLFSPLALAQTTVVQQGTANNLSYYKTSTSVNPVVSGVSAVIPSGATLAAPTQAAGDNTTFVATDAFVTTAVNNAIAGVNPAVAVLAASTTNLTGTYSNGVAGIGATFTITATGAFTLDGVAINTIGQRVLLKNQATGFQNGVYTATIVGVGGISPVFTRALDYDTPSDINSTGAIPVQSGTANISTSWLLTSTVTTVGTDSLTYVQFSLNPSNLVSAVSPGVGIAHFAGSTQIVTSSLVALASDVSGQLPIGAVGSAGLSGTAPIAIAPTGIISITGAAGQVLAGATPAFTATPALGTDNSVAGTLTLANSAANAHTIWSSGATTTNTIAGFTVVPTTGHLVTCTVSSTTCTLTDGGAPAGGGTAPIGNWLYYSTSGTGTVWTSIYGGYGLGSPTTGDETRSYGNIGRAATLSNMCVTVRGAQGSAGSLVVTLRQNTATPGSGPVVTIAASDPGSTLVQCDNTHTLTIAATDVLDYQITNNASNGSDNLVGISILVH